METKDGMVNQGDVTLTTEKPGTPNVTTFTQEQVEKLVRDARSAVLADAGRARKSAEDALARLAQREQQDYEDALEAAKDDPKELARIEAVHEAKNLKTQLAAKEEDPELNEFRQWKAQTAKEKAATEIAKRLNVDASKLASLARFTDGSPEAIEALAKELPKTSKKLKPDSGNMIGGLESWEEVRAAYIKDPRDPVIRDKYLKMRAERKR